MAESLAGSSQWSVLGPILFLVKAVLITAVKKFVDDTKLGQVVHRDQDSTALQKMIL